MPVFGSPVCEWLLWVAVFHVCWQCLSLALQEVSGCCGLLCFKPADNACPWLSSLWVAAVGCCVSSLLIMPVLGSPASEWLLWVAVFQACWQCLSLALQLVSGCCGLLCFKPADNACAWLFSLWVAAVGCCISSLLTMPVLGSPGSEWLLWVAVFHACWQCLSLALQSVSGYCGLLCFKPADNACPWLSSMWVAAVGCCVSSLLTMPVLGSPASEWLLWVAVFQACWQCLSLALQLVSGCCELLCFKVADNFCPWPSS